MPIYEYVCSACAHRTDILHGLQEEGPAFCPSCGAEHTMKKAFTIPAVVFKGTGWAKKERRSAPSRSTSSGDGADGVAAGKDGTDRSATGTDGGSSEAATASSRPTSATADASSTKPAAKSDSGGSAD